MLKSKLRKKILKIREKIHKQNIKINFNQIIKIIKKEIALKVVIDPMYFTKNDIELGP